MRGINFSISISQFPIIPHFSFFKMTNGKFANNLVNGENLMINNSEGVL